MLLKVSIDGYRSLKSFSMELRPGLNILVGPNGSGKTNIISFFQFVARLTNTPLSSAISQMGGVGAFFSKEGHGSYRKEIDVLLVGSTENLSESRTNSRRPAKERRNVSYVISMTIKASDDFTSIYFKKQSIKVRFGLDDGSATPRVLTASIESNQKWDLVICLDKDDDEKFDISEFEASPEFLEIFARYFGVNKDEFNQFKAIVAGTADSESLFINPSFMFMPIFQDVLSDLRGGEVFNIMPSKIREQEDISKPFGVRSDGSGLYATLYHLRRAIDTADTELFRKGRATSRRDPLRGRPARPAFKQIVQQLQLVNSSIRNLKVDSDPLENSIKVRVVVSNDDVDVELPLNLMSDGTLKWLALTTAIITSGSIFAVEEPENYLHPLMQKEILEFIRSLNDHAKYRNFVIMSTHSETLLNAAKPSECVIVNMSDGTTITRRPANPVELERLIAQTGFGLGHLYISGTLDHV